MIVDPFDLRRGRVQWISEFEVSPFTKRVPGK